MRPFNFSTRQEYDNYTRCKRKIRVGDKVRLYLNTFDNVSSTITSRKSDPIDVISFVNFNGQRGLPLIGAKKQIHSLYQAEYKNSYGYIYVYVLVDTDARIAEIIRGKQ